MSDDKRESTISKAIAVGFIIGAVVGSLLQELAFESEQIQWDKGQDLIEECEKSLPRDEFCTLKMEAVPDVKDG